MRCITCCRAAPASNAAPSTSSSLSPTNAVRRGRARHLRCHSRRHRRAATLAHWSLNRDEPASLRLPLISAGSSDPFSRQRGSSRAITPVYAPRSTQALPKQVTVIVRCSGEPARTADPAVGCKAPLILCTKRDVLAVATVPSLCGHWNSKPAVGVALQFIRRQRINIRSQAQRTCRPRTNSSLRSQSPAHSL